MNTMLCDDDNEIVVCEFEVAESLVGLASKSTTHGGASSSRQRGKSEAEKQAQRRRRVVANRESAKKTIYRRQAIYADLISKEAELSVENEILKKEKERAVKEYDNSKIINEYLKAKVAKMAEIEEEEEESKKSVQIPISPLIFPYNHPSIVPFLWPAIGIQGSSQSHIAISTQFPIPMSDNILCSFQDQEHAKRINKQGTSLFTLPSPWSFPFLADRSPAGPNGCSNSSSSETPTRSDQNCQLTSSQKTKSENCNSAPVVKLTHKRMSCTKFITDTAGVKAVPSAARSTTKDVSFKSQKPVVVYSRLENANAATEARKRRRELMKLSIFTSINKREGIYGIQERKMQNE